MNLSPDYKNSCDQNNIDILLSSFTSGNDDSYLILLWKQKHQPLVRYANSLLSNNILSSDIVNETFIKLWQKRHQFDNERSIKSFLYKTVKNSCIDHIRSASIHKRIHEDIKFGSPTHEFINIDEKDTSLYHTRQIQDRVQQLPDKCREVFVMRYYGNMNTRVIARKLEVSPQTVRNQLSKAVNKIAEAIKNKMVKASV